MIEVETFNLALPASKNDRAVVIPDDFEILLSGLQIVNDHLD